MHSKPASAAVVWLNMASKEPQRLLWRFLVIPCQLLVFVSVPNTRRHIEPIRAISAGLILAFHG